MAAKDQNETILGREKVREAAAQAIESIRQRYQDTAQLVAALQDQDSLMRVGAAFALGMLGDERARKGLPIALTDAEQRLHWGAAALLDKMKENRQSHS